jgi:methionine transaminase
MIKSKLPNVGTTIFTVMSKLAAEHNAINLGQGFPGFQMDMKIADLVHSYMKKGFNQYAPMQGTIELRRVIADKINAMYGHFYSPEHEITITAGGTQAIFTAISSLIHSGDEVVMFAPAYDCYAPAVELNGGIPVWINLTFPDFRINWEEVKNKLNERTKLIIINSPHNPSGTVMSAADMNQLELLVKDREIVVLSDEVYEHLIFDGVKHESVSRYPDLAKKSLVVFSFGKTFHNTGWKMGYICAPEYLMNEFRKVHQFNVFSCNTPIQYALADYMSDKDTYLKLPGFFQEKRDKFLAALQGSAFTYKPAEGTYFQVLGYDGLFDEADTDLAVRLTREFGIASIPCSVFYPVDAGQNALRFCFAKEDDLLERAGKILSAITGLK